MNQGIESEFKSRKILREKLKKLTLSRLIILEYIETIINQILYYRFMYPESAFIPLKKYSLACHFVRGDIMTDYLSMMLNKIETALKNNSLRNCKARQQK